MQYKVTNAGQMYACRFLIGTAGGFLAPAVSWYLGCWYKKSEIYRRGALFYSSATAGAMSSGIIQAAIHRSLDGKLGLEGWRWLYIICKSRVDSKSRDLIDSQAFVRLYQSRFSDSYAFLEHPKSQAADFCPHKISA